MASARILGRICCSDFDESRLAGGKENPYAVLMIMSRITAKSQTTVPQAVRRALGVGPGDRVGYEIDGDRVTLSRVSEMSTDPFVNPFANFTEWASEADSAYDVLATR